MLRVEPWTSFVAASRPYLNKQESRIFLEVTGLGLAAPPSLYLACLCSQPLFPLTWICHPCPPPEPSLPCRSLRGIFLSSSFSLTAQDSDLLREVGAPGAGPGPASAPNVGKAHVYEMRHARWTAEAAGSSGLGGLPESAREVVKRRAVVAEGVRGGLVTAGVEVFGDVGRSVEIWRFPDAQACQEADAAARSDRVPGCASARSFLLQPTAFSPWQ